MQRQNRNVRVTYPDSPNDELEIDVVQGIEVSFTLTKAELRYYAKDGVVKLIQNVFANPGYRNFRYSKAAHIYLNNESSPGNNDDDHPVDLTNLNWVIDYHRNHR